ncbi:MAG: hypothetical protein J2P48_16375 [Alphaproteobacteria bacterium]|nr:hypothetical protein [Alphaproteobacteria bacterium]
MSVVPGGSADAPTISPAPLIAAPWFAESTLLCPAFRETRLTIHLSDPIIDGVLLSERRCTTIRYRASSAYLNGNLIEERKETGKYCLVPGAAKSCSRPAQIREL